MPVRVITGSAGGLFLKIPAGVEIRPTQDRVKQAIFSSLGEMAIANHVLDLYAGSGGLGLEALSRGALQATFVEANAKCCQCLRANLEHCRLQTRGRVVQTETARYLRGPARAQYDLVFGDPPYVKNDTPVSLPEELVLLRPWLVPGAVVAWEYFGRQPWQPLDWTEVLFQRQYGETGVVILRCHPGLPPKSASGFPAS